MQRARRALACHSRHSRPWPDAAPQVLAVRSKLRCGPLPPGRPATPANRPPGIADLKAPVPVPTVDRIGSARQCYRGRPVRNRSAATQDQPERRDQTLGPAPYLASTSDLAATFGRRGTTSGLQRSRTPAAEVCGWDAGARLREQGLAASTNGRIAAVSSVRMINVVRKGLTL